MNEEQIKIVNLEKSFGELKVLNSINFSIFKGETLSILGPSGSGKTTLLRCISGLDKNYNGKVYIDNKEQNEYLEKNRISFVTQKYSNFPWLTVYENIFLGFKHRDISLIEKKQKTHDLIETLHLLGFENYFPNQLSGGMQQRVAIGRALAQDTEILAMDEPFGALDFQTRESLQLLIKNLKKRLNKTIIFVTHDIEEAIFISGRIIVLSKLPSIIAFKYNVPQNIKSNVTENVRFQPEFINMRKKIEDDIKSLTMAKDNTILF